MLIDDFRGKNLLFLSPHFDDIALSCCGLLKIISPYSNVILMNVFSISNYAPYCPGLNSIQEICELRSTEDLNFCKQLNIKRLNLGFKEAPLRGFDSMDEIFSGYNDPRDREMLTEIMVIFKKHSDFDFIFTPIGFCTHVDHEIVRKAACVFREDKVIYYEEQSYLGEIDNKYYSDEIKSAELYFQFKVDITNIINDKLTYVKMYHSQVTEKEVTYLLKGASRASENSGYKYAERYWKKGYEAF